MLFGKDGGRRKHSSLLAVCYRAEHGAERHFGLTETNVAANKPVHNLTARHIRFNVFIRGNLVGRFFKRESGSKRLFEFTVCGKSETFRRLPLAVEFFKVERHLFDAFFDRFLYLLEVRAADFG